MTTESRRAVKPHKKSAIPGVTIKQFVEVIPKGCSKPDFERKPITLTLQEGKNAVFRAVVKGEPPPKVIWKRSKEEMNNPDKYQMSFNGITNEFILQINKLTAEDTDLYHCSAVNEYGEAACTAGLKVIQDLKKELQDYRKMLRKRTPLPAQKKEVDMEQVWQLLLNADRKDYEKICLKHGIVDFRGMLRKLQQMKKDREDKQQQYIYSVTNLKHIKVNKEGNATFHLEMDLKNPESRIYLYKDGQLINYGFNDDKVKHCLRQEGKKYNFTINHLQLEDAGVYQIKVEDVDVFSTELEADFIPVGFRHLLSEVHCHEQGNAIFECSLYSPCYDAVWLYRKHPIEENDKYKISISPDGLTHQLVIKNTQLTDKGTYTLDIRICSSSAWLEVEPRDAEATPRRSLSPRSTSAKPRADPPAAAPKAKTAPEADRPAPAPVAAPSDPAPLTPAPRGPSSPAPRSSPAPAAVELALPSTPETFSAARDLIAITEPAPHVPPVPPVRLTLSKGKPPFSRPPSVTAQVNRSRSRSPRRSSSRHRSNRGVHRRTAPTARHRSHRSTAPNPRHRSAPFPIAAPLQSATAPLSGAAPSRHRSPSAPFNRHRSRSALGNASAAPLGTSRAAPVRNSLPPRPAIRGTGRAPGTTTQADIPGADLAVEARGPGRPPPGTKPAQVPVRLPVPPPVPKTPVCQVHWHVGAHLRGPSVAVRSRVCFLQGRAPADRLASPPGPPSRVALNIDLPVEEVAEVDDPPLYRVAAPDSRQEFAAFVEEGKKIGRRTSLQAALDAADSAARTVASGITLRRISWLQASTLPPVLQTTLQDLPFEGRGLFSDKTDPHLQSLKDGKVTLKSLGMHTPWLNGDPLGPKPAARTSRLETATITNPNDGCVIPRLGGHLGRLRTQGRWSADELTLHINIRELRAVRLACQTFQQHLRGRCVSPHASRREQQLHTLDVRRALAFYVERTKPFRRSPQLFVAVAERMKDPPNVDKALLEKLMKEPVIVKAGQNAMVKIPFKGRKPVRATWLKDGDELLNDARIHIDKADNFTRLLISSTDRKDCGDYKVKLKNENGTLEASLKLEVIDKPQKPVGPIEVVDSSTTGITIRWKPPEDDGGTPVQNYIIEKQQVGRKTWVTLGETSRNNSTFTTNKVRQDKSYRFRVRAVNAEGKSKALESDEVMAATKAFPGPPAPPQIVSVNKESITLSWKAPPKTGNSRILGYIVEKRKKGSNIWTPITDLPITDRKWMVTDLKEGLQYEFRVAAVSATGVGETSAPSDAVFARDPMKPPGRVRDLKVTNTDYTSITLAWMKPDSKEGGSAKGYKVEKRSSDSLKWTHCNTVPIGLTTCTVKGLQAREMYFLRVRAVNEGGLGEALALDTCIQAVPPIVNPKFLRDDTMKNLMIIKVGNCIRVHMPFEASPTPEAIWLKDGLPLPSRAIVSTRDGLSQLLIPSAEFSDSGLYTIILQNEWGKKESFSFQVQVTDIPQSPGPILLQEKILNTVTVIWEPSPTEKWESNLYYVVMKCDSNKGSWQVVGDLIYTNKFTITKLIPGRGYYFRVVAKNYMGTSDPSETVQPWIMQKEKDEFKVRLPKYRRVNQNMPPRFLVQLKPHVVTTAFDCHMSCAVGGYPKPKITWYKDGRNLSEDPTFFSTNDFGVCCLVIPGVTKRDEGEYKLEATNELGHAVSKAMLIIKEEEKSVAFGFNFLVSFEETIELGKAAVWGLR
ncbi:immunoglobulin-like and fibronectin type III domain-containing protein 1 [Chelonoidis abingdonii]|uniref:immunoglobulin-like and fibronectin type III domain-containing protein 1 n=1 Tax=Chelonoidis abingdonii TaxID=106734 RepID=UPI003F494FBA